MVNYIKRLILDATKTLFRRIRFRMLPRRYRSLSLRFLEYGEAESKEIAILYCWMESRMPLILKRSEQLIGECKQYHAVPPRVYMFWDAGLAQAPSVVKWCEARNREVEEPQDIEYIDNKSLGCYKRLRLRLLRVPRRLQHKSDLLRLELLARYGGVWLDSDIWIRKSLLGVYRQTLSRGAGFLALTEKELGIRVGILGSEAGGLIVCRLLTALELLWEEEYSFFLESVAYHHIRWLFICLCLLDDEFMKEWSSSYRLNASKCYTFVRLMKRGAQELDQAITAVEDTDFIVLTHKRKDINVAVMESIRKRLMIKDQFE